MAVDVGVRIYYLPSGTYRFIFDIYPTQIINCSVPISVHIVSKHSYIESFPERVMARSTTSGVSGSKHQKHSNPLSDEYVARATLRTTSKKRKAKTDDDSGLGFVDSRSSKKILKIGRELAEEDHQAAQSTVSNSAFDLEPRLGEGSDSDGQLQHDEDDPWGDEDIKEIASTTGLMP